MQELIKHILDNTPYDELGQTELNFLIKGSPAAKYNQLKRAVQKGDLIRIRRGLYLLHDRYQRSAVNLFHLAHRIYGPSYISFESALSSHGLIPEAVYSTTSATTQRSRSFKTPRGIFTYTTIPSRTFSIGIKRVEKNAQNFLIATPLKALVDYLYTHQDSWKGLAHFMSSLRIDSDYIKPTKKELQALNKVYKNPIVLEFIKECHQL